MDVSIPSVTAALTFCYLFTVDVTPSYGVHNFKNFHNLTISIVRCVFLMVVVSILPRAEFELNDHREDAQNFII